MRKLYDTANNRRLMVILNKNCNFNCSYCYHKDGKLIDEVMSKENIEKVTALCTLYEEKYENASIEYQIYGGEPLFEFEKLTYFITRINNVADRILKRRPEGEFIDIIIFTNARVNLDKFLTFCKNLHPKLRILLQVSYDGKGGTSPKNDLTFVNILKKHKLPNVFLRILTVIYEDNADKIYSIYEEMKKYNLLESWLANFDVTGIDFTVHLQKFLPEYRRILEDIYQDINKPLANNFVQNFINTNRTCGAGTTEFCIGTDGKIYYCGNQCFGCSRLGDIASKYEPLEFNQVEDLHNAFFPFIQHNDEEVSAVFNSCPISGGKCINGTDIVLEKEIFDITKEYIDKWKKAHPDYQNNKTY